MSSTFAVSRRSFLRGAALAGAGAAVVASGASFAFADEAAIYTPGTYTGTGTGISSTVTVTITVDETSITAVEVDASGETATIGAAAADTLAAQILEAQSADIDGVSGATITSNAVRTGAAAALEAAAAGSAEAEEEEAPAEEEAAEEETTDEIRKDSNGVSLMDDWLGTAPEYAEEDIDEELEADIIVVGGGLAGISAARAACEEGSSVIVFEKCASYQCRSGDFGVIGSEICEENWGRGCEDQKMDIVDEIVVASGNRSNFELVKKWADNVGEAFDWYANSVDDLYILSETCEIPPDDVEQWLQPARYPSPEAFDIETDHYRCYQVTCQFYPSQEFVFEAHVAKAEETGLFTGYTSTPVKKLLREDDGPVTGVIAESYDGVVYRATANKAVILTTGDYSSNDEMYTYYNPWCRNNSHFFTSMDPEGNYANTGDGDKMAMWIGAKMEEGPHASNNHNMGGVLGSTGFLELSMRGKRFHNEDVPGQELDNRLHSLYQNACYQIFDAAWVDEVQYMSPSHGQVCALVSEEAAARNSYLTATYGYANQAMVDSNVESGSVLTADTIEELVAQFDMDDDAKATAIESIERYNELANAGEDVDFGKMASRMFALENPPYYACKFSLAGLLVVNSGLEVDEYLHVLDEDREVIPHLFAAGNNAGGRYACHYPITVPGSSHSSALTYGRLAGTYAAQEL